jgi:gas vesicle protein
MVKIAVEHPFTSIQEALKRKGYHAEMLEHKSESMDFDCVVVRDKESLADYTMNVPLVEAHGRTLYEIIEEVEERLVRIGKLDEQEVMRHPGTTPDSGDDKSSAGGFIAGAVTGAVIGAAAGLLLTPKSGKEMQQAVKEKVSKSKDDFDDHSGETKEKLTEKLDQLKEKANEVKGQASEYTEKAKGQATDYTEKAKGKVDELKAKKEEKKEEKELKKQEKEVQKEAKQEEKALKEHEKAEKQARKEIEKAEKDEKKEEKGKIEVVEMGDAKVEQNSEGKVMIQQEDKDK